jgi:hypothetical protein
VRLLYASRAASADEPRIPTDPLVAIGRELRAALELSRFEEGSLGHRAARDRAARALSQLAAEVSTGDSATRLVRVAQARVRGR